MIEPLLTKEAEALKFLSNDFNQCFQQMRYYDAQIFDIIKFMFTAYTALTGAALALYKIGVEKARDLSSPAIAILIIGFFIGIFMLFMTARNRSYYVRVARYINEQRKFFLEMQPLGYINKTDMFMGGSTPRYFNLSGTQSWFTCLLAFFNSSLIGTVVFIALAANIHRWNYVLWSAAVLFVLQIIITAAYLAGKESKKKKVER